MFALSVVMGFYIAFNDWRVRESIFGNQLYRYLIMMIFAILLIPLLSLLEWFSDDRWKLLLAFLSGILCFYLVSKITVSLSSNKP
jgi:surface polysaccharide O-acyltransferase-like enzyme